MAIPATKVANPATLPNAITYGVAMTPDGKYIAFGTNGGSIYVYKLVGPTLTLIQTISFGSGAINNLDWSDDGVYLAVACQDTQIGVYKRVGDVLTALTLPTTALSQAVYSCKWNQGGTNDILLFGQGAAFPSTYVLKRTGDTFANIPTAFADANFNTVVFGIDFSADGERAATVCNSNPNLRVFKRSSGVYVETAAPTVLPVNGSRGITMNGAGDRLVVGCDNGPNYLMLYTRVGDVWTKQADFLSLPPAGVQGVEMSDDGSFLIASHYGNGAYLYTWDGAKYVRDTTTITDFGAGISNQVKITPANTFIAMALRVAPNFQIYQLPPPTTVTMAAVMPKMRAYGDNLYAPGVPIRMYPAIMELRGTSDIMRQIDNDIVVGGEFTLPAFQAQGTLAFINAVRANLILPKLRAAAAGTVEDRDATGAFTLPKFLAAGLGAQALRVTLQAVMPKLGATGLVGVEGLINADLHLPALRAAGVVFQTVQIDGSGGLVIPAFKSEGLAWVDIWVGGDISLPMFRTDGLVIVPILGAADLIMPAMKAAAEVDDEYPIYDIEADLILPAFTAQGAVVLPLGVVAHVTLPMFLTDGAVKVPTGVLGSLTLPAFTSDGLVGVEGFITADLVMPRMGFRGELGYPLLVDANLRLPAFRFTIAAKIILQAEIEATLPMFRFRGIVQYGEPMASSAPGPAVALGDGKGLAIGGGNINFGNGKSFP